MDEIIKKYEAKLDFLNKSVDKTEHLLDSDTKEILNNMKILLTEVVTDFRAIKSLLENRHPLN